MDLKRATLLAAFGFTFIILVRTLGLVFPNVFENRLAFNVFQIGIIAAGGISVIFFVYFYRQYFPRSRRLEVATILAIIASVLILFTYLRSILLFYSRGSAAASELSPALSRLVLSPPYQMTWSLAILLADLMFFYFAYTFYREALDGQRGELIRPTLFASLGFSIFILLRTIEFVLRYLLPFPYRQPIMMRPPLPQLAFVLICFSAGTILYFFREFYRWQKMIQLTYLEK